jgi:hypothetical protein
MGSENNRDKRSRDPNPQNIILAGRVADPESRIRISLGSWIRIRIRVKIFSSFKGTKWNRGGPWTLTMEVWRLKMETWRVCKPMVADSHDFDEEQGPYPDPL